MLCRRLAFSAAAPRRIAALSTKAKHGNPASLSRFPAKGSSGLYDAAQEVDSCGVGMVAHLKGEPSHSVVKDANTMLVRMAHRGGCGCDPASGDGAGILTGMPDSFLRSAVKAELGAELPPLGSYAAGIIFFPRDPAAIAACKAAVEKQINAQGMGLIGWRPLPVDNSEYAPPLPRAAAATRGALKTPRGRTHQAHASCSPPLCHTPITALVSSKGGSSSRLITTRRSCPPPPLALAPLLTRGTPPFIALLAHDRPSPPPPADLAPPPRRANRTARCYS